MKPFVTSLLRAVVILTWSIFFALLLERDYFVEKLDIWENEARQRSDEESFMGVYLGGERIGYVKYTLRPNGSELALTQESYLLLNVLQERYPVKMIIRASTAENLALKTFAFTLSSPLYEMQASGEVSGREIRFTMTTGKEEIRDTLQLAEEPLLSTNDRRYLLKSGLKAGDRFKVPYFDPISLAGEETLVEYQGREKVVVRGRIYNLHHFVETFQGMRISCWLDDEGKVLKEESPAGFVFIAEPEFQAMDVATGGLELLRSVAIPVSTPLPDPETLTQLRVRLKMPSGGHFDHDKDRQQLSEDILTVDLESLPSPEAPACAEESALAATPYVQANSVPINRQLATLVDPAWPALQQVTTLSRWVFENVEKRPVIGLPDALTVLDSRRGDCNEHAVLFAALARSSSIPTRIAAGVVLMEDAFYYHAWNEVCVDGRWLTVDTTKNQIPADVTHIKLVEGDTQEQVRIGALIGTLGITVVDFK